MSKIRRIIVCFKTKEIFNHLMSFILTPIKHPVLQSSPRPKSNINNQKSGIKIIVNSGPTQKRISAIEVALGLGVSDVIEPNLIYKIRKRSLIFCSTTKEFEEKDGKILFKNKTKEIVGFLDSSKIENCSFI